jgi:hypothetical protein
LFNALFEGLITLGLDYLLTTVKTGRADVVTQMGLARGWLNRCRRVGQKIMCAMHATLGWGLFILLNCHDNYS